MWIEHRNSWKPCKYVERKTVSQCRLIAVRSSKNAQVLSGQVILCLILCIKEESHHCVASFAFCYSIPLWMKAPAEWINVVSHAWAMRSAHSASVGRFGLISFSDPDLTRVWCRGQTDMLFLYASDSVHPWEIFGSVNNFWLISENKSTNDMFIATHRLLPIGLFHVFIRFAVSWEDERSLYLLMNIYYAVLIAWCIYGCGWAAGQHVSAGLWETAHFWQFLKF